MMPDKSTTPPRLAEEAAAESAVRDFVRLLARLAAREALAADDADGDTNAPNANPKV